MSLIDIPVGSLYSTSPRSLNTPSPDGQVESGTCYLPNLESTDEYVCRTGVPVLTIHTEQKKVKLPDGTIGIRERLIDQNRLELIVANSNRRCDQSDYGLIFIGHTTDKEPEVHQPPVVGYIRNYRMGEWAGKPCVLADLYFEKCRYDECMTYPRRSSEVYYSDKSPENNFIDSVALIRRTPNMDLGLLTYRMDGDATDYELTSEEPQKNEGNVDDDATKTDDLTKMMTMMAALLPAVLKIVESMESKEAEPVDPPQTPTESEKNDASVASGTNTSPPEEIKTKEKKMPDTTEKNEYEDTDKDREMERNRRSADSENIKITRLTTELAAKDSRIKALEDQVRELSRNARNQARERQLIQLEAEGYELDRNEEIESGEDLSDTQWNKHVDRIKKRYSRSTIDAEPVDVVRKSPNVRNDEERSYAEVKQEREAILRFSRENNITDPFEAVNRYRASLQKAQ